MRLKFDLPSVFTLEAETTPPPPHTLLARQKVCLITMFLSLLAEKANESFYGNRRQVMEMATKGSLPMEALDMEPEPSNPYSPPRQLKQNGHRYKSHRSHSSQSLCYSSAATAVAPWPWEGEEAAAGVRQGCVPKRLCIVEKEVRSTRYVPPQPYFVTNSKTEVTV